MFKFLFEGKIGEMLAPVTGISNQIFLTIQQFKNDEFQQLLATSNYDLKTLENGYAAIHVACRYGNRFALEVILNRGINADYRDSCGNTPLHYASKYGQVDFCKALIEKGCSASIKNNQGETAYDVATNHIIRQYLLPLQFQAERENSSNMPSMPGMPGSGQFHQQPQEFRLHNPDFVYQSQIQSAPPMIGGDPTIPTNNSSENLTPPSPYNNSGVGLASVSNAMPPPIFAPPTLNLGRSMSLGSNASTNSTTSMPLSAVATPPPPPPVMSLQNPPNSQFYPPGADAATTPGAHSAPSPTPGNRVPITNNPRIIRADGFHSSASDPALQAKYGHIKETINIAPPPTSSLSSGGIAAANNGGGAVPQYSMFGQNNGASAAPTYNRYVVYDVHSDPQASVNNAAPAPRAGFSLGFSSSNKSLPTSSPVIPPPHNTYPGGPPGPPGALPYTGGFQAAPPVPAPMAVPPVPGMLANRPSFPVPTVNTNVPAVEPAIPTPPSKANPIINSRPALCINNNLINNMPSSPTRDVINANASSSSVM